MFAFFHQNVSVVIANYFSIRFISRASDCIMFRVAILHTSWARAFQSLLEIIKLVKTTKLFFFTGACGVKKRFLFAVLLLWLNFVCKYICWLGKRRRNPHPFLCEAVTLIKCFNCQDEASAFSQACWNRWSMQAKVTSACSSCISVEDNRLDKN